LSSWDKEFRSARSGERKKIAQEVIEDFSSINDESSLFGDSLKDKNEFIKLQVVPFIYVVPFKRMLEDRLLKLSFCGPLVLKKHKTLPMIFGVTNCESLYDADVVPFDEAKDFDGIPQVLSYAKAVPFMEPNDKKRLYSSLIDGIKSHRNQNEKKEGWFSDYLSKNDDFNLVGFALNHTYYNLENEFGETAPMWVHPWGSPILLYQHKRLPAIMLVGPWLRLDENVLGDNDMTGFTG